MVTTDTGDKQKMELIEKDDDHYVFKIGNRIVRYPHSFVIDIYKIK